MAQDLKYIVKPELDSASAKAVRDQLNALEKSAQTLGGRAGGTGGGSGRGDETAETKELALVLDELTQKYLENAQALVDMNMKIGEYKDQLKEIAEAKRINKGLTDEEMEQEQAIRTALKDTTADYNAKSREMIVLQQENEALGNSYFEIEKRMKALSVQIKSLDMDTQGEEVKRLTTEYNALNTRLKEVDASMGNNQRNVGDYENSIRAAANALAVFQGPLGPVAGRLNAFATTLKRFETQALAGSKSAKILAMAMKALYLASGPILIALGALIAFFKGSEEGQEKLRVGMAMLKAVLNTVKEVVINLGKALFSALSEPKQAVIDLWEAIKQNLIVRLQAIPKGFKALFGAIVNGAKGAGLAIKGIYSAEAREEAKKYFAQAQEDLKAYGNAVAEVLTGVENPVGKLIDGVRNFGKSIADNTKLSGDLERAMNRVLRTERQLSVERAKQDRDLQKARDTARDLSASFEERLEALSKVREAEIGLIEKEMANERERLRIMQAQVDQFSSTKDELDELAKQQAKVFDLERTHLERSMSLRRDENSLIRARNELLLREAKRALDEQMRISQGRIAKIEREYAKRGQIVEIAEKRMADFQANRIEEQRLLEEQYKQELINQYGDLEKASAHFAEATGRAKHEINLKYLALNNSLLDAQEQRERSLINARLENESLARQTALNDELAVLARRNDTIGQLEAQQRALREQKDAEYEAKLFDLKQSMMASGIEATEAGLLAEERLRLEYAEQFAQIDRRMADEIKRNREELLDATVQLSKAALTAMFGDNKEVAVSTAIIDTLAAMNKAYRSADFPLNMINAATVALAGFANVRKILATKINSKDTSAPSASTSAPQRGFGLVDLPRGQSSAGNLIATQTAGMVGPAGAGSAPVIILDGEFDKEALAVKVRQGNNAISSRSIRVGA